MDEQKFLFVDTKEDSVEFLQWLTLISTSNAITCTEPLRSLRTINEFEKFKFPLGSYTKRNINDFKPVDSLLVKKCIESAFIGGTLNRNMDVIKNTKENRKILGI